MDALMVILGVIVAIAILDVLAVTVGADSRPGYGMSRTPDRIIPG